MESAAFCLVPPPRELSARGPRFEMCQHRATLIIIMKQIGDDGA